jgi:hypothetical protein
MPVVQKRNEVDPQFLVVTLDFRDVRDVVPLPSRL